MSPLAYGPNRGPHRVLDVGGTQGRCRVHRKVLAGTYAAHPVEDAAALRLAADAAARLKEAGLDVPARRPVRGTQARCPECVQEYAEAAAARVHGDSPQ